MKNKQENLVIWEKWVDPFGDKEENDIPDDGLGEFIDDHYEDETEQEEVLSPPKQIKVIATPMGIIPINEQTASGKIFNFWTGHTNFSITPSIAYLIEKCDGVECLDIFTRYRFRIAIGKVFTDSVVMKNIQDTLYENLNEHDE